MNHGRNLNGKVTRELKYVTANRFYVEIDSQIAASFTECQGLGIKIKCDRYAEGGVNNQQRLFLGQTEFSDITLKRGLTDDLAFLDWVSQILTELIENKGKDADKPGKNLRRNVNILVFNQAGETMQCWTLIGAVPVGWKAPSLQANSNTVAIEELTLACEGVKISTHGSGSGATTGLKRDSLGYFSSH